MPEAHEFLLAPPVNATLINRDHRTRWVVSCTPVQARRIAEEVEKLGWSVEMIHRIPIMSLEETADEFGKLKLVAQITGPSPWDEYGNWTPEALKQAKEGGVKLYNANGTPVDLEPSK